MTKKYITVSLRIPVDVVKAIDLLAQDASRDRSKQIMHLLRNSEEVKSITSGE